LICKNCIQPIFLKSQHIFGIHSDRSRIKRYHSKDIGLDLSISNVWVLAQRFIFVPALGVTPNLLE
jgi:hypothetical protein